MTTAQILTGFGLIILLAVGSQVVASRLRIPGLIVLLPAGFTAGALTRTSTRRSCLARRSSRWCPWRWRSSFTTRAWASICASSGATPARW